LTAHNIDTLFRSLARHAGPRTIGVILSGLLKEAGGVAVVQDPGNLPALWRSRADFALNQGLLPRGA
jgi:hypothetical protein